MNQELEQYLRFFIDHRQKYWLEWLVLAEFIVNNKIYLANKLSPFITNYGRELKMGANIRRKSNRVYRKNEEDTERSRSSIKKGVERDKVVSG